jgi:hypothetical protein
VECRETATDTLLPGYDAVLTPAELDAARAGLQSQYDAIQAAKPAPTVRQITPTQFLTRLPADRAALLLAAAQNTPAGVFWVMRLVAASTIDLDSAETVGSLTQLRDAGALTQADMDTLLA